MLFADDLISIFFLGGLFVQPGGGGIVQVSSNSFQINGVPVPNGGKYFWNSFKENLYTCKLGNGQMVATVE